MAAPFAAKLVGAAASLVTSIKATADAALPAAGFTSAGIDAVGGDPSARRAAKPNAKNLLDINAQDTVRGRYVDYLDGIEKTNYTYCASGFIPCVAGQAYYRSWFPASNSQPAGIFAGQIAFYDQNKVFISGLQGGSTATWVAPTNAWFQRVSIPVANWMSAQIEEGTAATAWVPANADEPPKRDEIYQPWALRQTRYRLAKLSLPTPEAAQLVINLVGDSYFHNRERVTQAFTEYMTNRFGDAGGGWCGFGFLNSGNVAPWTSGNQPSFLNGNARPTYATRLYGSISSTYYTEATADIASVTLSASGHAIEQDFPASPAISAIQLHYIATGSGSIRYTLNGGSTWTTLSLTGTAGATTVVNLSLTGLSQPGTLRIEWVSGSCKIDGVDIKSAANGVRVNKLAATGSTVNGWTAVSVNGFQTSFSALGGHLTILIDGTNSQAASTSGATWAARVRTMIGRFRGDTSTFTAPANGTAMDVMIVTPPENQRAGNTVPIAEYAFQARRLAYTLRTCFVDLQFAFGDFATPLDYGSSGSVPLYNADLTHPEPPIGGRLMLSPVIKAMLPF